MRTLLSMVAVSLLSSPAVAAPPPWQGIWEGKIGNLPVIACLRREDWGASGFSHGFYYYLSQRKIIALEQKNGTRLWVEKVGGSVQDTEPAWTFADTGPGRLTGNWVGGGTTLSFALVRKAGTRADAGCDDYAFNGARITPTRIVSTPATKDGVAYTRLIYEPGPQFELSTESFVIAESNTGDHKVNALLRALIPANLRENEFLECEFGGLRSGAGSGGDWSQVTAPKMITRNWIATETARGYYCGGAHPDSAVDPSVYDRRSGRKVEVLDWFTGAAVVRKVEPDYVIRTVTPAFRAFLLKSQRAPRDDCREALDNAEFWTAGVSRGGVVFTPSLAHVEAACEEETTIPFSRIERWLNPAGRAAVASIRADLAAR